MNDMLLKKIISAAYGDANLLDKIKINRLANKNKEVKELLESYKQTALEVHKLKEEEYPDELLTGIENLTVKIIKQSNIFSADIFSIIFTRPLASAAAVLILVTFILLGIFMNRSIQHQYTKTEIENADRQTRQALDIVSKIFYQTNITLKEEVLNSRVAKPIRESIVIVNDLFAAENKLNKGEKQ